MNRMYNVSKEMLSVAFLAAIVVCGFCFPSMASALISGNGDGIGIYVSMDPATVGRAVAGSAEADGPFLLAKGGGDGGGHGRGRGRGRHGNSGPGSDDSGSRRGDNFDDRGFDDRRFDDHGSDDFGFDDHGDDDFGFDDHGVDAFDDHGFGHHRGRHF